MDQFAFHRSGLGHTIRRVLLKTRMKSLPSKVAPKTGTIKVMESLRALLQMQVNPMEVAGGAVYNSVGGFAVNSNKHQPSAS